MELFELEDMIAQIQRENAELRKANKETRKKVKELGIINKNKSR